MKDATFFLSQTQYNWLAVHLPEPVPKTKPVTPNNELLNGVLYALKTGCRWQDIPETRSVVMATVLVGDALIIGTVKEA